ncbi:MAG: selenocysteine-specific translation elongation factor [Armatimonadota bacterium]|nr:selenocysteine-specific translation elongation factor [Armatimonadota bacterium]
MKPPVTIGTAGHIDHGKSALVRALTGIDPDRLAEEQRRGMTLDLGFAHLDLPSGRRVGIVDVPGHEALVHNMLAGAGGIDLVMLVVAADEGVMPQTREHLDILRFLRLAGGVVVLNKIDLVSDPEWVMAVEQDLADIVTGTPLEDAPIVRVSARTGEGLPELLAVLDRLVEAVPGRPADGPVRLPVDRAFTMRGFGTVVTGTLWSGTIRGGDLLVVLPEGRAVRVRGLQVHGTPAPEVYAGSRVAVNLAGIDKEAVQRGDVLATPDAFSPTDRLDVRLRLLPGTPALRHAGRVHLHLGSGATVARVVLFDRSALRPGEEGLAQLRLERPVVAVHGDRFVVRRYSPTQTMGGGVVLNASPPVRRRGADAAAASEQAGPGPLVVAAVAARGQAGMPTHEAARAAGVEEPAAAQAVAAALREGTLVAHGDRLYAQSVLEDLHRAIEHTLRDYHARVPWRRGMPREELKPRVLAAGSERLFEAALSDLTGAGRVTVQRGLVALSDHAPRVHQTDGRVRELVQDAIERGGVSPPPLEELRRLADPTAVDRMLQALIDDGLVVPVGPDLRFSAATIARVRQTVVEMLRRGEEVTVAIVRDRFQTSRRYALALLEYLDGLRVTRRVGDRRVLGPNADSPTPSDP